VNDLSAGVAFAGLVLKITGVFCGITAIASIPLEVVSGIPIVGGYVGYSVSKVARDLTKEQALSIVFVYALPTALRSIESVGTVYFATLNRVGEWVEMGEYSAEISLTVPSTCVVQPKSLIPPHVPCPPYVASFNASVQGYVTITSKREAKAAVLIEIFESGGNDPRGIVGYSFDVVQNTEKKVCFDYPLTGIFTLEETQKVYSVVIHVAIGTRLYTLSKMFIVVRGDAPSAQGISTSSFSGEVGEGESVSQQISVPLGASGLLIALNYAGSDLDLHLYDSQGRHVGINYQTGEVETQIPGASYNGPNLSREWIIISNLTSSQSFTAEVVGVEVHDRESFSLSYLIISRAIEIVPVTSVVCPGQSTLYEICVVNFGDKEEEYVPGLRGLEQDWYSFDPQTIRVKPGETAKVKLTITVPSDAILGNYIFMVYFSNMEVPVGLKVARLEDVKDDVLSMLKVLKEYINALPPEAFSKERSVTETKKALFNKINAVIKMVEEGAYNGAIKS